MALSVLHKCNFQTRMFSHPVGLDFWFFGQTLHLLSYSMCANSKSSDKTARMRRLAWAFTGHIGDKYHTLMSLLNYWLPVVRFSLTVVHTKDAGGMENSADIWTGSVCPDRSVLIVWTFNKLISFFWLRHILSWRLGHDNVSTAILPLPLIQEEQLSVTGEGMCTKYW